MALTAQQKTALRDWLEVNVHKAAFTVYYREGIKDEDGKPIYGQCVHFDEITGIDRTRDVFDEDGNLTGTEPDTYYGRTFTKKSFVQLSFDEVVRRTVQKAKKQGLDPTHEEVAEYLEQYVPQLLTWAGATHTGSAYLTVDEIDAIDPDA